MRRLFLRTNLENYNNLAPVTRKYNFSYVK